MKKCLKKRLDGLQWWLVGVGLFHLLPMALGLLALYLLTR